MVLKLNVEWTAFYEYKGVIMKRDKPPVGGQSINAVTFNGGDLTGIVNGTPKGDDIFTSPYRTIGLINNRAYLIRFTPAKNSNNSSVYNMTGEFNSTLTDIIVGDGVSGVYKASRTYISDASLESKYSARYSGAMLMEGYENYGESLYGGSVENLVVENQINGGWKKLNYQQSVGRLGFGNSVPWEHFMVSDGNGYLLGGGSLSSDNFDVFNANASIDGGGSGVSAWDSFSSKIPDDLLDAVGMNGIGLSLTPKIPNAGKEYITRSLISDNVETKLDYIKINKSRFGSMDYNSDDYNFWGGGFVRLLMVTSAQSTHVDISWEDVYTHTSKGKEDLVIASFITGQPGSKVWNLAYKDTMEVITSAPLGYAEMPIIEDNGLKALSTQTAASIQANALAAKVNMDLISDVFKPKNGSLAQSLDNLKVDNAFEAFTEPIALVLGAAMTAGVRVVAAVVDEVKQVVSTIGQGGQIAKGLSSMYSPVNVIADAGGNTRSNSNVGAFYWDGSVSLGWWDRIDTKGIGSSYALFGGTENNRTNNYYLNTITGTKEVMDRFVINKYEGLKYLFDEYTSVSYQEVGEPHLTDLNQYKYNY